MARRIRDRSGDHWSAVWEGSSEESVSWFESTPTHSLELIRALAPSRDTAILDVGAGESRLVDALVCDGYRDLTVLDIAEPALAVVRDRLGSQAEEITWVAGDVLEIEPGRSYGVWHDRALFHFLRDPDDRDRYRSRLRSSLSPGGVGIVATFSPHGPEVCSGLPVERYSVEGLVDELGAGFTLVRDCVDVHRTPGGVEQEFTFVAVRRVE